MCLQMEPYIGSSVRTSQGLRSEGSNSIGRGHEIRVRLVFLFSFPNDKAGRQRNADYAAESQDEKGAVIGNDTAT